MGTVCEQGISYIYNHQPHSVTAWDCAVSRHETVQCHGTGPRSVTARDHAVFLRDTAGGGHVMHATRDLLGEYQATCERSLSSGTAVARRRSTAPGSGAECD